MSTVSNVAADKIDGLLTVIPTLNVCSDTRLSSLTKVTLVINVRESGSKY